MGSQWKNEDDIKAELRVLTEELRTLRHELRNMVAPPKASNPTRALLHRHAWPLAPSPIAGTPETKRDAAKKKS